MFYLVCKDVGQRTAIINELKSSDILAVFHYISLHSSPYFKDKNASQELQQSDKYSDCLLRLPMFYELDVLTIIKNIKNED